MIEKFPELRIKDKLILKWVDDCLKVVPSYFWEIPASTSGRYHNKKDCCQGGIIKHTRRMLVLINGTDLNDYNGLGSVFNINCEESDMLQAAVVLHDSFRCGKFGQERKHDNTGEISSDSMHPLYPREVFKKRYGIDVRNKYDMILQLVEGHYGVFSPIPQVYPSNWDNLNRLEQLKVFMHTLDMISSRTYIDIPLDDEVS